MPKGATAEKAEEKTENAAQDLGKKIAEKLDYKGLKVLMTSMLKASGYADEEITDELIYEAFMAIPTDTIVPLLRKCGLMRAPHWLSSLTGWHNAEHMRSKGARNKFAGLVGFVYQFAAFGLAGYMGYDYLRNRDA